MDAEERLKTGDLSGALELLQDRVRDNPSFNADRVFLFQLLAVMGQWERAMTQLDVASQLDASSNIMAKVCRPLLLSEQFREQVFKGVYTPLVFGEPPAWSASLLRALQASATNDASNAFLLCGEAFEAATPVTGVIDGNAFQWLSDADMRLGPMIEAVVNGKYYWIPLDNFSRISIHPPEDLRDVVWVPAEFEWRNKGKSVGFLPARYPLPVSDQQMLGRVSEWKELGHEYFIGMGQKVLTTDTGEFPLLTVREIKFDHFEKAA